MLVVEDYLEKDKYYKSIYGDNTFLLYLVGTFYEVYACYDDPTFKNIEKYSSICNLVIANKGSTTINDKKVCITDIRQIMVCICHQNNTIHKTRFLENDNLKIELDPNIENLIKNILEIN